MATATDTVTNTLVLTPPDVVSQLMLAIPLVLLYEITIIAIWFTDRRQKAAPDAEATADPAGAAAPGSTPAE